VVQHDLDERLQGRRQPRYLPVAVLAAAVLLAGCGGGEKPARQILLVSGRDDHGLLVQDRVELSHDPGVVASHEHGTHDVPDGALVRVLETRGEWIRVATLEGPRREGWLNDYYLRGTVHVCGGPVPRGAQAELLSVSKDGVRIRTLVGAHEASVPRGALSELPCP
jgi:hypothetical protein